MAAIDIHFHVLPQLFVDAVRGHTFDDAVAVDGAKATPELVFRPPAGVAVEQGPPSGLRCSTRA